MPPARVPPQDRSRNPWRHLAWLFSWLLAFYALLVAPLDGVAPWVADWRGTIVLAILAALAASVASSWPSRGRSGGSEGLIAVTVFSAVALGCALLADVGYTAYTNVTTMSAFKMDQLESRRRADQNVWEGESAPDVNTLGGATSFSSSRTKRERARRMASSTARICYSTAC